MAVSPQVSALRTRQMRRADPLPGHCHRPPTGAAHLWTARWGRGSCAMMCGVGRHSGDRPVATTALPRRRIAWLTLWLSAALVAWGVLVWAAIDLGREARSGASEAWWVMGVATVGAAACLFVVLLLGARLIGIVQGRDAPQKPARIPGGRRAAR